MTARTVTITADLGGWYVTDGDRYWQPSTTAEAALPPAEFARRVAATVSAVYVAPKPAAVSVPCDTCDSHMSCLLEAVPPTRCYTCVHGPVMPMAWSWVGPSATELAARADAALLAGEPVTLGRAA